MYNISEMDERDLDSLYSRFSDEEEDHVENAFHRDMMVDKALAKAAIADEIQSELEQS